MRVWPSLSRLMFIWTLPESALLYCTKASTHVLMKGGNGTWVLTPPPDWPEGGLQMICSVLGLPLRGVMVTRGAPASSPAWALIWKMWVKFGEGWKPDGSLNFQR